MLAAHTTVRPTCGADANQDIVVVGSLCCYMARRSERTVATLCLDVNNPYVLQARPADRGPETEWSGM